MQSQIRKRLLQITSDPTLQSLRQISKCPSFSTEGPVKKMVKSVPLKTMLMIFSTGHPELPYSELSQRVDIKEFSEGSKKAIEVVSKGISRRDFSQMSDLLTDDCCQKVKKLLNESIHSDQDLSLLAVKKEDIFFQFISEAKISDDLAQINLVSYSLSNLDQCIKNTRTFQNFHKKMQDDFKKKKTVLQREDFDAAEYRKVTSSFEFLNPGRLVKENDIHITNYKFSRRGSNDWEICSVGHLATADHWTWFRRFKWKGRLHISIQFNLPFMRALRYDYIVDTTWICLLIYLQILALMLAKKAEEGDNMNMRDGELEGVYWRS